MNLLKFYRVQSWFKTLGISLVALFSAGSLPSLTTSILALTQMSLVYMYAFSLNDYLDYKFSGERNQIIRILKKGVGRRSILFLSILPLVLLTFTLPLSPLSLTPLLFLLIFLPLIYQGSLRLKKNYLNSILINSLCSSIAFLYPFLLISGFLTFKAVILSIIFFFYMSFHEAIHQIAHLKKDKVNSLPKIYGVKNTIKVSGLFLAIPIIVSLLAIYTNPWENLVFTITILFSVLRLVKLSNFKTIVDFQRLRNRWDKFYSAYEGVAYILFFWLSYTIF